MAVDLKFYDDDVMELSNIDIGKTRIGYGTVTKIKLKNEGDEKARNCIISAAPLNTLEELEESHSEEEAKTILNEQKQAASWKSFSLSEDGDYVPELSLGSINPGCFLEGTQELKENFSDKDSSMFKDEWSYCLEKWGNGSLKIYKNAAKSQTAQRKSIDIGNKRDVRIQFKLDYEYDSSVYAKSACLVIFPVRIDSRGYGYILSFQFRASDGKCFFGVYKNGKGMVSNLSRIYGTRILDTGGFKTFDPSKFMGANIYTDDEGNTCFEFILNGEKQVLYDSKNKKNYGTTMIDADNTHPKAGGMYFDVGMYYGDLSVTLKNFTIGTETEQAPIYVKSKMDSTAIDGKNYNSAISVSYL